MATSVPERQLGTNGPKVSAIGFGAMGLSAFYGTPAPDEERFKVLDRAIELGSTYIDSADIYGDNEELIGKYFKKNPEKRQKVRSNLYFPPSHENDKRRVFFSLNRSFWQQNSPMYFFRMAQLLFAVMLNMFENRLRKV